MKRRIDAKLWSAAAVLIGTVFLVAGTGGPAALAEGGLDGKEVFLAQKCNMCHAVPSAEIEAKAKSEKMKGPDLPTANALETEAAMSYLRKLSELEGKSHKKASKASDEELTAVIEWLAAQPAATE